MTGRLSEIVAGAAGILALLLVGTAAGPTILGAAGVGALALGLIRRRSGAVSLGAAALFGALLWSGVERGGDVPADAGPGSVEWTIVAAGAAILLAWSVGRTSVELRRELPGVDTRRLEATHVAGTTVVVGAGAAIALLPQLVRVRASPLGIVLVVFGAVTLTTALWRA